MTDQVRQFQLLKIVSVKNKYLPYVLHFNIDIYVFF